jgi:putative sterol carrier protein
MTTKEFFESKLKDRLADAAEAEKAKAEVGAVYKFVINGDGGGTWLVNLKDEVGITEGDGEASCTVTVEDADFVEIIEGRLNGQMAFMQGKLKIDGDMSLAMKLQTVLGA